MSKKMPPILLSNIFSYAMNVMDAPANTIKLTGPTQPITLLHQSLGIEARNFRVFPFFVNEDYSIVYAYGVDYKGKFMIHDVSQVSGRDQIVIYPDTFQAIKDDQMEYVFNEFKKAIEFIFELISPSIFVQMENSLDYSGMIRIEDINLYTLTNFCNMYGEEYMEKMLKRSKVAPEFWDLTTKIKPVNKTFWSVWKNLNEKKTIK